MFVEVEQFLKNVHEAMLWFLCCMENKVVVLYFSRLIEVILLSAKQKLLLNNVIS